MVSKRIYETQNQIEDSHIPPVDESPFFPDYEADTDTYYPDPIRSQTELDAKIIQSDYKDWKVTLRKPRFKKIKCVEVYKDKKGKIKKINGVPVVKRKIIAHVFDDYEEEKVDFPVKLYSDSLTSSILDPSEANAIRVVHDLLWVLGMKMLTTPDVDYTRFLHRLNGNVATLLESAKSIGGGGIEFAKTTITKAEQRHLDFRQQQEYDEFQNRKQNRKGLFGGRLIPGVL